MLMKRQAEGKSPRERVVIVGVGNLLLRDEGIGIHAAKALQGLDLPDHVEVIDGGTSPDLIAYVNSGDKLIIIDAVKAGGEPGAIYRFTPDDLDPKANRLLSLHELGVLDSLQMMRLGGNEPEETIIIGIEPEEITLGTELTSGLQQRIPDIIQLVLKEIGTARKT